MSDSLMPWLSKLTFQQFIWLLGGANVAMYLGSWAGIVVLQRLFAKSLMNAQPARVRRHDVLLSLVILSINIGVGIPGWWLWKHGYIILVKRSFLLAILDGAMMFFYFDLAMYCLHRLMHSSWLYDVIHRRHHDHTNVSGISLYVMNPVEAAGFGILLILFLLIRTCDVYALLVFLFFNWAYGTVGHSALPISGGLLSWLVGNAVFHHKHHTISGAITVSLLACGIAYGEPPHNNRWLQPFHGHLIELAGRYLTQGLCSPLQNCRQLGAGPEIRRHHQMTGAISRAPGL